MTLVMFVISVNCLIFVKFVIMVHCEFCDFGDLISANLMILPNFVIFFSCFYNRIFKFAAKLNLKLIFPY